MATILVVDDERMLCDLLQEMLRRHGHEILTAYSGQEAIELHRQRRPQFTLLDLTLPDMNGIEVLTRIRESDPKAAVMILTGSQDQSLLKEALDLESVDILGKPFDLERVALAIQVGLILTRRSRESGSAPSPPRAPAS